MAEFFKHNWDIIKEDITAAFIRFQNDLHIPSFWVRLNSYLSIILCLVGGIKKYRKNKDVKKEKMGD